MVTQLIRHRRSKKFLARDGSWTHSSLKAWCFKDPVEAVKVKDALKLDHAELCFREDDGTTFVLAMFPPPAESQQR